MTKAKEEKPKYDRVAVYTGRRLMKSGEVYQRFELLPNRDELFFAGVKRVFIGEAYECNADRMPVRPVQAKHPNEDKPEWEAADALVDAHRAVKRAEAKAAVMSNPNLKRATEALSPLFKGLDYFNRKALVEFLATKVKGK